MPANTDYNANILRDLDNDPTPYDGEPLTDDEANALYNQLMDEATEQQRIITPDQQIANVQAAVDRARGSRRHQGRAWEIRAAEQQLAEMIEQYRQGKLQPIFDDPECPF